VCMEDLSTTIGHVQQATMRTNLAANNALQTSKMLARQTVELGREVENFLTKIRA
jgi:hypothetical protein